MIRLVKLEDIKSLATIYKDLYDDADIGELFVDKDYQERHLAKELYKKHLSEAQRIYRARVIEFHTYGDENEFPQSWYRKIGFKKDKELIIMNANIEQVLEHLEPERDMER